MALPRVIGHRVQEAVQTTFRPVAHALRPVLYTADTMLKLARRPDVHELGDEVIRLLRHNAELTAHIASLARASKDSTVICCAAEVIGKNAEILHERATHMHDLAYKLHDEHPLKDEMQKLIINLEENAVTLIAKFKWLVRVSRPRANALWHRLDAAKQHAHVDAVLLMQHAKEVGKAKRE